MFDGLIVRINQPGRASERNVLRVTWLMSDKRLSRDEKKDILVDLKAIRMGFHRKTRQWRREGKRRGQGRDQVWRLTAGESVDKHTFLRANEPGPRSRHSFCTGRARRVPEPCQSPSRRRRPIPPAPPILCAQGGIPPICRSSNFEIKRVYPPRVATRDFLKTL